MIGSLHETGTDVQRSELLAEYLNTLNQLLQHSVLKQRVDAQQCIQSTFAELDLQGIYYKKVNKYLYREKRH